ncbi:unnamed protein product [Rotaria sp. Silwood1]|nr:unnamed protein product [Rotaria sp. Silwood1]CAF1597378.1 unnamed protein product [Rotaria sp. Silwood1]CAF3641364.1 unnamed protein product [Rotaria sp. Silwood1]CAF3755895.1 unnamed protein product [Rotaria sp. Silwood1]CAF4747367.1 unnamed protein product [Rotaria sp. Silwood1]
MPRRYRLMRPYQFPMQPLPSYVDLRRWMTPVEDQQNYDACVANAFAGIIEYLILRRTGLHIDVSRMFIYYNGRMIQGQSLAVSDDGTLKRDTALGLRKFGVCQEFVWPYELKNVNKTPPPHVYDAAKEITVVPLKIPRNLPAMKTCLANGVPFLIGIALNVTEASDEAKQNNGYVSMPDPNDPNVSSWGFHAVIIVGYDDRTQNFIVRNSWGANWITAIIKRNLVNADDGVWAISDIMLRLGHLPSVRRMMLPGHNRDARYRHNRVRLQSRYLK